MSFAILSVDSEVEAKGTRNPWLTTSRTREPAVIFSDLTGMLIGLTNNNRDIKRWARDGGVMFW